MRSIFACGAVSTTTTVHGMPAFRAAYATPCPAFPALIVQTPRLRSAGREHRDRVRRAAQLVRVDRLEILELEADVGKAGAELESHERRANDRVRDARARGLDVGEGDGTDGNEHQLPFGPGSRASSSASASSSYPGPAKRNSITGSTRSAAPGIGAGASRTFRAPSRT